MSAGAGVKLGDGHTTLTLPHRKFTSGGHTYYVATYPEGDLALHESHHRSKEGYGRLLVGFLMEDDSVDEVLGPFSCDDFFDHGRRARLAEHLGEGADKQATRIVLGFDLAAYKGLTRKEVWAEDSLACDPVLPRLRDAVDTVRSGGNVPAKLEAAIYNRGGARILRRAEIINTLKEK